MAREELHDIQHLSSYRAELQHRVRCLQTSMPWIEKSLTPSSHDALFDELVVLTILEHDVSTRIQDLLRRHSPSSQHTSSSSPEALADPSGSSDVPSMTIQPQSSADSVSTAGSMVSLEQPKTIELYPYSAGKVLLFLNAPPPNVLAHLIGCLFAVAHFVAHGAERRKWFGDLHPPATERNMQTVGP
jgi:hypothetical protein